MRKTRFHKIAASLLCVTMLGASLAGCGGSETATETTKAAEATTAAAGAAETTAAAASAESTEPALAAEQVLNIKYTDLSLIDVNDARNANEFQVLTEVQEGLFRTFTVDGQDVMENAGCTSYDVSEDGLTYTFHLREDAMWSDGVPVTAQNYVDSWMRLIVADNAFPYAELALGIVGAEEFYNGEGAAEDVAIKLIDDYTFSATLKAPDASFVKKISMVCFYPIRQDLIDAAEAAGGNWTNDYTLHVFNGPFVISDRVLENSMTLAKNEKYWDAENVILEQINLQVVAEDSTMAQLMESEQMDIWSPTDMEYVGLWQDKVDSGLMDLVSFTEPSVTYVVVDQHEAGNGGPSGLMRNEKIRLAMSIALDREEFNDMFNESLCVPAYSLVPYGINVGNSDYRGYAEEPLAAYAEYTNDTEYLQNLFKEGLAELNYTGDLSDIELTVFTYSPNTRTTNILEWYKQTLESKLGIKVKVDIYPDVSTWKTARDSYQYDFYEMGWNGDFNDPITFLDLFRTGNGYAKFMGGYSNEEYDNLLAAAASELDEQVRLESYAQAEKLLMEEGGVIPLYFNEAKIFVQSYVEGLSTPMFGAEYEFSRAYILEH